jgi:hypothetical protein
LEGLLGNIGRLTLAVASYWQFLPTFYTMIQLVSAATSGGAETHDDRGRSHHDQS